MWNATKNEVPRYQIDAEHMRVLEDAVQNCEEDFDVRSAAVYAALDHFQEHSVSTWGFTLFRQGLEDWQPAALHEGLRLIKQHIGYVDHRAST